VKEKISVSAARAALCDEPELQGLVTLANRNHAEKRN
jgi:hypothetical protein